MPERTVRNVAGKADSNCHINTGPKVSMSVHGIHANVSIYRGFFLFSSSSSSLPFFLCVYLPCDRMWFWRRSSKSNWANVDPTHVASSLCSPWAHYRDTWHASRRWSRWDDSPTWQLSHTIHYAAQQLVQHPDSSHTWPTIPWWWWPNRQSPRHSAQWKAIDPSWNGNASYDRHSVKYTMIIVSE